MIKVQSHVINELFDAFFALIGVFIQILERLK